MSKTAYNISLKGFVGGPDFDRDIVDKILADNDGKQVYVLIDSLGGSLASGLSISAAFSNHGNVYVHFVGLNASAATIASLGAAHISMDAGAMYLVHKCSMAFFEWGSLNADQFAALIADCEKIKADLDKLDLNCAQLYAKRCKRKPEDLLALMKSGGWLSAKEALDWGFVDEITDIDDEPAPKLSDDLASALASAGIPLPNIPLDVDLYNGPFAKFFNALCSFFKSHSSSANSSSIMNSFNLICETLGVDAIKLADNKALLSVEQLSALDNHFADLGKMIEVRDKTIAELQNKIDNIPAAASSNVFDDSSKKDEDTAYDSLSEFCSTGAEAVSLFNSLP